MSVGGFIRPGYATTLPSRGAATVLSDVLAQTQRLYFTVGTLEDGFQGAQRQLLSFIVGSGPVANATAVRQRLYISVGTAPRNTVAVIEQNLYMVIL